MWGMDDIDADALLAEYLDRVPRGHQIYMHDPLFHGHIEKLRRLLPVLNAVLGLEGLDPEACSRVLRTVVYGHPDPDEAIAELRRVDAELDRWQAAAIGEFKPDHQFEGILGWARGEQL
jgi:hypothetical protein